MSQLVIRTLTDAIAAPVKKILANHIRPQTIDKVHPAL